MNIGKVIALGTVSAIAINALGYFAMNTGIGYNIIVFGCIAIVEVLAIIAFVKWIFAPSAEEKTTSRGKRAEIIYDDSFSDYEAPDIDLKEAYDNLDKALENCDVKEN